MSKPPLMSEVELIKAEKYHAIKNKYNTLALSIPKGDTRLSRMRSVLINLKSDLNQLEN